MPEIEDDQTPDPNAQAAPPAAPPQAAIPVGDLAGSLVEAYRQITASQAPVQHQVQDPFDAMTQEQRDALKTRFLTDEAGATRQVMEMGARATEQRMLQQAMPLIQTSANTIVELYKTKKQRTDPYFNKVEPLFDRLMVGVDITPLVRMNDATRNNELDMRWKMARADVLELEMKKQKPEPTLLGGGGGSAPAPNKIEDDPWMANMAATYGYTKEQMAELEAISNG